MRRKLLLSLFISVCTAACAASPKKSQLHFDWPGSLTGRCYPSTDAYIKEKFPWTADEPDENILIAALNSKSEENQYFLISDQTPSINVSKALLQVSRLDQRACVILDVIYASSLDLQLSPDGSLPAEVVTLSTALPGFPSGRVIYRWDSTNNRYWPASCEHETAASGQVKAIQCELVFTD